MKVQDFNGRILTYVICNDISEDIINPDDPRYNIGGGLLVDANIILSICISKYKSSIFGFMDSVCNKW